MEEEYPLITDSSTILEVSLLSPNVLCWTDVDDDNCHILWCASESTLTSAESATKQGMELTATGCFLFARTTMYFALDVRKGESLAGFAEVFSKAEPFELEPLELITYMLPSKVLRNLRHIVSEVFPTGQQNSCYREYAEQLESAFLDKLALGVRKQLGNFYIALR